MVRRIPLKKQFLMVILLTIIPLILFGVNLNLLGSYRVKKLSEWASTPQKCYEQHKGVYNIFHTDANKEFWETNASVYYEKYQQDWKEFVRQIPIRPQSPPEKGVVYTCYTDIVRSTLVSITMLRKTGCTLPIEVWHYGDELNSGDIKILEKIANLTVRDLKLINDSRFRFKKDGDKMYEIKGAAIYFSRFDQLLFLDGDVSYSN